MRREPSGTPPKIDGVLDDEVWQQEPLILGDWVSYNPLQGEKSPFRTDVRIAYDDGGTIKMVDLDLTPKTMVMYGGRPVTLRPS